MQGKFMQYDITDYNKYCFWSIWGEVTTLGEVPRKWPVCNTDFYSPETGSKLSSWAQPHS